MQTIRVWLCLLLLGTISPVAAQLPSSVVEQWESLVAQKEYDQALEWITTVQSQFPAAGTEAAHSRLLRSKVYMETRQYKAAQQLLDSLLMDPSLTKQPPLLADVWFQQGLLANNYYRESQAVHYFMKVDSIADVNKIPPEFQTHALLTIGDILFQWRYMRYTTGNSKPAHFYQKALDIAQQTADTVSVYRIQIRLAFFEAANPSYDQEIPSVFEESKAYFIQHNHLLPLMEVYHRWAKVYMIRGQYAESEALYKEYILRAQQNQLIEKEAMGNWQYAILQETTQNIPEAIAAYERAKTLFETQRPIENATNYSAVLASLADLYYATGQMKEAYEHLGSYHHIRDSLDNLAQMHWAKELETKFQTAEKDKAISQLQLKNQQKNTQILLVILVALIIGTALLFYYFRQKQLIQLAQQIAELDRVKQTFFANISHEFRTPLTLIKSPVQQLQTTAPEEDQKLLQLIDSNANRMLELVDQLLELSQINSGTVQLILKKGNLHAFLVSLIEPFDFQASKQSVDFQTTLIPTDQDYYFDKDLLTKIITNLINNAFKYHQKNTPIHFRAEVQQQQLLIQISNTNTQLKESDLKKVFDRFYQKNSFHSGSGIGLALVKDLVAIYEGSISAWREKDSVVFSVQLPLDEHRKNAVIIEAGIAGETSMESSLTTSDDLPVLLIADDHPDIRRILVEVCGADYRIIQVSNGLEAYEIAQKEVPDCILTDVMMPGMDGFTLTQKLKNNDLTASVPVIILTAKSGDDNHLQGLHSWADAYLTKPFNHQILQATIQQLLHERKKLQTRYRSEKVLKPVDIQINSADEKFIDRLEKILETQLPNPDFTAEDFAHQMHLSRMQLHRKLKSLFGVPASEFLRIERLKIAADLLKNKSTTISEIAYSVGFNDIGYFSKSFKDLYGMTPSQFRESDKNQTPVDSTSS